MATESQVSSTLSSLFEVPSNDKDLRSEIEEDLFEEAAEVDADLGCDIDFSNVDEGETFKTIQKPSEGAHTATTRRGYKGYVESRFNEDSLARSTLSSQANQNFTGKSQPFKNG